MRPPVTSRGMQPEDVHAMLIARAFDLGIPPYAAAILGVAESWLAAACREVPGFADWLDKRVAPWENS
jgi:hypothetical protein